MSAPRTGLVSSSYVTRAGETVWIIAFDDRRKSPPEEIRTVGQTFKVGERVQLLDGLLSSVWGSVGG